MAGGEGSPYDESEDRFIGRALVFWDVVLLRYDALLQSEADHQIQNPPAHVAHLFGAALHQFNGYFEF